MKDHKVVLLLESMDKLLIRKLKKFLKAEYPGFSEKSVSLGLYILEYYPAFENEYLGESFLLERLGLHAGKPNAKHELTRCLSDLLAAIEHFIAIESLETNTYIKGSFIANFYYQSQNTRGLSKAIKQNRKLIEKENKKESANFLYSYINNKLAHNFEKQKKNLPLARQFIEEATSDLNIYFMIQLFQAAIGYTQSTRKAPSLEHYFLLPAVIDYVETLEKEKPPLLILWKLAYQLTQNPHSSKTYDILKTQLLKHFEEIHAIDANSFITILSNALRFQIQKGRKRYIEEKFNLYQIEIREGWLIVNGIMGYNTFNNIVVASLALDKIEYAQSFIRAHGNYILPDLREPISIYNEARIAFAQGHFKHVLQLTQRIKYFDDSVKLGIKRLQCMCYYELNDYDGLGNSFDAFKMAIHRIQNLDKKVLEVNSQFLKIVALILRNSDEKQTFDAIYTIIQKTPFLPELEWVKSKMEKTK